MLEFAIRIITGAVTSAIACAVLWVAVFTLILPWPGHAAFTPAVFVLGILPGIVLGQKGLTW